MAFLWKKQRVTRNKGIQEDGNSSCLFSECCGGFPDVRHTVRLSTPDRMWLAQHARSSPVVLLLSFPGTMTNLFTRQLRHLILSMWRGRNENAGNIKSEPLAGSLSIVFHFINSARLKADARSRRLKCCIRPAMLHNNLGSVRGTRRIAEMEGREGGCLLPK